jgi:hypothetical protein
MKIVVTFRYSINYSDTFRVGYNYATRYWAETHTDSVVLDIPNEQLPVCKSTRKKILLLIRKEKICDRILSIELYKGSKKKLTTNSRATTLLR